MHIECVTEKISHGIQALERVVSRNTNLPILKGVLFIADDNGLKIRATNLDIGVEIVIQSKVHTKGTVLIPCSLLAHTISHSQSKNIVFKEDGGLLHCITDHTKISLKTMPNEEFPTIPIVSGSEFTIAGEKMVHGIEQVVFAAAQSEIKPEIASVYISSVKKDELLFVSTDSFRLAEKSLPVKGVDEIPSIIIPAKNCIEISKILSLYKDEYTVIISENQISLKNDFVYVTSRLINGSFPDYKQIIPKTTETEITLLKQDLLQGLRLATVFSDKFNQITLSINPGLKKCTIFSRNNDSGEIIYELTAVTKGNPIEVSFNYKYISEAFSSLITDSLSLSFINANKPMVIQGVGDLSFKYLVMPMNR